VADPRIKELAYQALLTSFSRPSLGFEGITEIEQYAGSPALPSPTQEFTRAIPSITPFEPTMRQRLSSGAQTGLEFLGMRRPQARSVSQAIFGGPSSPIPANLGIADVVPFLGTALQTEEAAESLGRAGQLAREGEYGQAAMQAGAGVLGLVPGAIGTARVAAPLVRQARTTPPVGAIGPIDVARSMEVPKRPTVNRESFVPGVEAGQELIVHHNISPQKLQKVQRVGGMPVPSIAVSNVENPLTGFGEISLIGNPSMATPSARNPVFGFDAYTARAPRITYKFDAKSEKNLANLFSDVKDDVKTTGIYDLVDNWDSREYNDLLRAKFLKEKGQLPNPSDFKDKWDFSRAIQVATDANYPEYRAWVSALDNRLPDAGVNVQETIFKGFTPSGTRRYAEANLANLVKEMKGGAGSEGINYGVGNLRAVATPKFKKLDDIKASRSKIVPSEEFTKVKKEINNAYDELSERITKLGDQEGYGYRAEDVLYEIGQTKNVNLIDRLKVGADDQLKADIGIFIKKLRQLPTEYFEIKPQRAVMVSEFEGAIVPSDAPKNAVDYLRSQGIERIHFYSTPEERTQLFKQFKDKMFGGAPIGIGATAMQEEEEVQ
jgi:hypothetical protein